MKKKKVKNEVRRKDEQDITKKIASSVRLVPMEKRTRKAW